MSFYKLRSYNLFTHDYPSAESPPPLPAALMVSVCSPTPTDTASQDTFEWPSDLPWLRFMKNLSEAPIDILGLMVRRFRHAKSGLATNELSNLKYNATLLQEASYLGLSFPRGVSDPAKLSKFLCRIMPETVPGEHLLRSQQLNKDFDSAARELLVCGLYQISNKITWKRVECTDRRDELLLDLITQSGLVGSRGPLLAEPTVVSILEEVWSAALCRCQTRIVSWILDLGMDVNSLYHFDQPWICLAIDPCHSPLTVVTLNIRRDHPCCNNRHESNHPAVVSSHNVAETAGLLLSYGAFPDEVCCDWHDIPLETAIRHTALDIASAFVTHGIHSHGQEYLRDLDFVKLSCLPSWDSPLERQERLLDYLESLYVKAFPSPGCPYDTLMSVEGLIKAAVSGGPALLSRLREKGADFNCHTIDGSFPLGAVIIKGRGQLERIKTLMSLGASVNYEPKPTHQAEQEPRPTALHLASFQGYDKVLEALLENGASSHVSVRFCVDGTWLIDLDPVGQRTHIGSCVNGGDPEHARSPLSWAIWTRSYHCARLLLCSEAPVEGHELSLLFECPSPSKVTGNETNTIIAEITTHLIAKGAKVDLGNISDMTALDIAIAKGYLEAANVLIDAGIATSAPMPAETADALAISDWLCKLNKAFNSVHGCEGDDYDTLLNN